MCSRLEENSISPSVYIVEKVVIGHMVLHRHLAHFKEFTIKEEEAALLKMWMEEQLAGATRLRERQKQLQPSLTWRSRQDCYLGNKTKMMMMRRGSMTL